MSAASPDLQGYAELWVDMVPHVGQLTAYAAEAQSVVEFGVRGGVSTWALLDGLPADGTLVSYDINPNVPDMVPPRVRSDPRWRLVYGDTRAAEMPVHADLVMIDSGHDYILTVAELDRAAAMTPRRIVLHDYLYRFDPSCQVREAVDAWLPGSAYTWEELHESTWGLAVLRPR